MKQTRRALLLGMLGGLVAIAGQPATAAAKKRKERVIKIQAKKFVFTPNVIQLKVGEPVVLEFTALDFVHGFNVPGLKTRSDLTPGQVTRVKLQPDTAGTFEFLCDNFCGEGHEEMNGKFIVSA